MQMQTLAVSAPAAPTTAVVELAPADDPDNADWPDQYATIGRAQTQDHAAFEAVYDRYQTPIYNFVLRMMGGNAADAQELTADTFLKAYLALPRTDESIRYDHRLQSWLFRLAYNRCLDEIRHRRLLQWQSLGSWLAVFHPSQVASDRPDRDAERGELHEEVQRVLDRLKPVYRTCLILKEYFDYSYGRIAEVLHTTRAAVKSLIFRAREEFRRIVAADPTSPLFLALGGD